ncbi:MAG: TIR domain-containing protein [Lachnospiraceae bacterium]|nr:TIR domain-containing protein [Lachnospiraceae bacterium]
MSGQTNQSKGKVGKMEEIRKYCAFISYRHKELDKNIAKQIHSKIERYTVPKEMREKWGSKKLGKVFRDEEELPVSSNLSESICLALDNTDYLIVICTPDTPESLWVEREITYFMEHHDRDHVVAVLAKGTPETSFPKPLTSITDENGNEIGTIEPLAANLTGVNHEHSTSRLKKEVVRLYAAIMGCPFDSLWQREKRQRLHRMLALVSILAAVAIIYGITLIVKDQKIKEQNEELESINRELDAANTTLAEKNDELDKTNAELKTTNDELDKTNKNLDIANKDLAEKKNRLAKGSTEASLSEGKLQLENGEMKNVIKSTLDALNSCEDIESEEERIKYKDQAEYLLSQALGAEQYENYLHTVFTIEQESAVDGILITEDGDKLYTMDKNGYVRCYSTEDGELFWKASSGIRYNFTVTNRQRMVELKEYGLLICMGQNRLTALELSDGRIRWSKELGTINCSDFSVFNKDKSRLAVWYNRTFTTDPDDVDKFLILNTKDGNIEKEIIVGEAFGGENVVCFGNYPGVFTENEKTLYGMGYYSPGLGAGGACLFKVDIAEELVTVIRTEHKADDFEEQNKLEGKYPFVIGMGYDSEEQKLVFTHYDGWDGVIVTEEYSEKDGTFRDIVYGDDDTEAASVSEEDIAARHRGVHFQIPKRDSYTEYQTTFVRDEHLLLYSVESYGFVYSFNNGKIVFEIRDSNARIHNFMRLSPEYGGLAVLTEDGYQNVYWVKNGFSLAPFCDRSMIRRLSITPGYVANIEGGKGFTLSENIIEALVVDTGFEKEAKTVYILKPNKDNEYKPVDWFESSYSETYISGKFDLKYLSEGRLALWEYKDAESTSLRIIDAKTGEDKVKYTLKPSEDMNVSIKTRTKNALLWRDGKHFSYLTTKSNVQIYDLETDTEETVFVNEDGKPVSGIKASVSMLADGNILDAILCESEDSDYFNPEHELRYRIGNEEITTVEAPQDRYFCIKDGFSYRGDVKTGESGLVLTLLSHDREHIDGFFIYDTKCGESAAIDTEEVFKLDDISIFMGDTKPRFLTITDDKSTYGSVIRVYDASVKKEISRIELDDIRDEITSVLFLNEDNAIVVWTKSRIASIYDIETGKQVNNVMFEGLRVGQYTAVDLEKVEDPERNRVFLYTNDGGISGKNALALSTITWEKTADFIGFTAFCPETNEIYKFKNNYMSFIDEKEEIIKGKAYTLDDLIEKAKKY